MSRKRRLFRSDTVVENLIPDETPKTSRIERRVKSSKPQNKGPEGEPLTKASKHMPHVAPGLEKGNVSLGRQPRRMICHICGADITTKVKWKPSLRTHVIALLLCIFVLWPCVCVPYCTPACMEIIHYCPNCNSIIGSGN